ncbi:MAG: hypothetical protein OXE40_01065 [Gammaproteobacteria bacterium]|nr:hypothetical protein [Gammaproteobacteria bacterium]
MADEIAASRKLSPEFWAIVAVGITVLGQAVWLDGKIERGDSALETRIENLQEGQAAIRERLALVEGYLSRTEWTPLAKGTEDPSS